MNRFWVWGLSAFVAVTVEGLALAGDPNMQPGQTTLVQSIQNMFSPKPPKPLGPSGHAPLTVTAPLSPAVLNKCLQAEDEALLRRLEVCDALRTVADEKGDPALRRQADELEKKANVVYKARVAALGIPTTKTSLPETTIAVRLEEPAAPQAAANRLIAPTSTPPSAITAEAREVKP
jgi:hypothetical protein